MTIKPAIAAVAVLGCLVFGAPSALVAQTGRCVRLSDPLAAEPAAAEPANRANPWDNSGGTAVRAELPEQRYPTCWKTSQCQESSAFGEILNAYLVAWMARLDRDVEIRFDDEAGQCWIAARVGPQGTGAITLPAGTYRVGIDSPETREIEMRIRLASEGTPYGPLSTDYEILGAKYIGPEIADVTTLTKLLNTPTIAIDPAEQPKSFTETLTIRGLEAGTPTTARISGSVLERPLSSSRSVHAALSLIPGVAVTEATGTGGEWTVIGSRRLNNQFSVDGVSANVGVSLGSPGIGEGSSESTPAVATTGTTQTLVQAGAVDEIAVRVGAVEVPNAASSGAQVAVVTRSGSDRPRVQANGRFFRFPSTQVGPLSTPPVSSRSKGIGWSVGTPLRPRGLFMFLAYEYEGQGRFYESQLNLPADFFALRQRQQELRDAAPRRPVYDRDGNVLRYEPDPAQYEDIYKRALSLFHFLPDGTTNVTSVQRPRESILHSVSGRIDANLSGRHHVFFRAQEGRSIGDLYIGRFATLSNSTEATGTYSLTGGVSSAFGGTVRNELRVNFTHHRGYLDNFAAEADAEPLAINDEYSRVHRWIRLDLLPGPHGSLASGRIGDITQEQFQLVNTLTYQRGRHQARVGVDATIATATSAPAGLRYTYSFASLTQLAQGQVRQVLAERVQPASARFLPIAAFADDTVMLAPRLQLNAGVRLSRIPPPRSRNGIEPTLLRYDALPAVEELPSGSQLWQTPTTVAPRIGVAYQLRPNTVVRAAWSLVYDELSRPGAAAIGRGYPFIQRARFTPASLSYISDEEFQVPEDSRLLAEFYAFAPGLRPPRTSQVTIGVERDFRGFGQLAATFVGSAARDLVTWSSVAAPGTVPQTIHAYSPDARSTYRGLLIEHRRPLRRGLAMSTQYTWSRMRDTESGDMFNPTSPPAYLLKPSGVLSRSDLDRPHILRLEASYDTPGTHWLTSHWQLAGAVIARSGRPFSVTSKRQLGPSFYDLRADLTGEELWIRESSALGGRRLNPAAFAASTGPDHGNAPRNFLRASALRQIDLSLARSINVRMFENLAQDLGIPPRFVVRLNVTVFNVLNTGNYGPPISNLDEGGFGVPNGTASEALGTGTLVGSGLSPLNQDGGPRSIQMGLRVSF